MIEAALATYLKYTIADFSADAELRLKTLTFLDMILASAAIESLPNSARGDSRSRKNILEQISQVRC